MKKVFFTMLFVFVGFTPNTKTLEAKKPSAEDYRSDLFRKMCELEKELKNYQQLKKELNEKNK